MVFVTRSRAEWSGGGCWSISCLSCSPGIPSLFFHGATGYSRLTFALHSPAHSFKWFQNNQTEETNDLSEGLSQTSVSEMPRRLQVEL